MYLKWKSLFNLPLPYKLNFLVCPKTIPYRIFRPFVYSEYTFIDGKKVKSFYLNHSIIKKSSFLIEYYKIKWCRKFISSSLRFTILKGKMNNNYMFIIFYYIFTKNMGSFWIMFVLVEGPMNFILVFEKKYTFKKVIFIFVIIFKSLPTIVIQKLSTLTYMCVYILKKIV